MNLNNEESIVRSTIYLKKHIHAAGKEAGINFSQEFSRYLETILFGEEVSDLSFQLDKVRDRKKNLQIELTSLNARETELVKMLGEHDAKMAAERSLYDKFIRYMHNRITVATDPRNTSGIDIRQAASVLKRDYFPKNGFHPELVEDIMDRVHRGCFDFDCFKTLRKGGNLEN